MTFDFLRVSPSYEGAGHGRRLRGWNASAAGPVGTVAPGFATLRNRVRDACRNDALAAAIVRSWLSALVGSGIVARTQGADTVVRTKIDSLWRAWLPEADACGAAADFNAFQGHAVRGFVESGEVFIRLRPRLPSDGLAVPLQLQLLESDMCPQLDRDLENGRRIIQGIEYDAIGRRVAYHFMNEHPGDGHGDTTTTSRVPAEYVSHVFNAERPGQVRGVSVLAPVLARLRTLGDFNDAVLERQKIANLFVAFLEKSPSTGDAAIDPMTGKAVQLDVDGVPIASMEPGTVQELLPGESVKFSEPPGAGADYSDFVRAQIAAISVGVGGIPAEFLTGDLRDVSDRALRVSLNEWRRQTEAVQWAVVIPRVCAFVRNA